MRDYEIRHALLEDLRARFAGDADTLIVDELGLSQAEVRIDVAVVNGVLHGYEIKSARDTLTRLPSQAAAYSRVFDLMTLVVAERHVAAIDDVVPDWWGVVTPVAGKDRVVLREIRPTRRNPGLESRAIVELLWRDEALDLLEQRGLDGGLRSKPRPALWDALADALATAELAAEVRLALRRRSGWRSALQPA